MDGESDEPADVNHIIEVGSNNTLKQQQAYLPDVNLNLPPSWQLGLGKTGIQVNSLHTVERSDMQTPSLLRWSCLSVPVKPRKPHVQHASKFQHMFRATSVVVAWFPLVMFAYFIYFQFFVWLYIHVQWRI